MPGPLDLGLKNSARHYINPIIDFINDSEKCALYKLLEEQGYGHSEEELKRYIAEHKNDLAEFTAAWYATIQRYKRRVGYANKEDLLSAEELETYIQNRERTALVGHSIPTYSTHALPLKELRKHRKDIAGSGFLSDKEIIELDDYFYGEYVLSKATEKHSVLIDGAANALLRRLGVQTLTPVHYERQKDNAYQTFQEQIPFEWYYNGKWDGKTALTADELWQFLGRDGGRIQQYLARYYNQGQVLSLEVVKAILKANPEIDKQELLQCIEADYDDYRYYLAERYAEKMLEPRDYKDGEDKKTNMRAWEYVFSVEGNVYQYLEACVGADRLSKLITETETGTRILGRSALATLLCDYRVQNKIDKDALKENIEGRYRAYREEHAYTAKKNKVEVRITLQGEVEFFISRSHASVSREEHLGYVQSLLTGSWIPEHLRQKIGRRFYLEHVFPRRESLEFQRKMQEIAANLGLYAPKYRHINTIPGDDQPAELAAYIATSLEAMRKKAYEEPLMEVLLSIQGEKYRSKIQEKGAVNYFTAMFNSPKKLELFIEKVNLPQDEVELQAWYDEVLALLRPRADDQHAFNPIQRVMAFFRDKTQDSPELAAYRNGALQALRTSGVQGVQDYMSAAVPAFADVQRFHQAVKDALPSATKKQELKDLLNSEGRKHFCHLLYKNYAGDTPYTARYLAACRAFEATLSSRPDALEILDSYLESEQCEAANAEAQLQDRFGSREPIVKHHQYIPESAVKKCSDSELKKATRAQLQKEPKKGILKAPDQDYATRTERSFRERYQQEGQGIQVRFSGR